MNIRTGVLALTLAGLMAGTGAGLAQQGGGPGGQGQRGQRGNFDPAQMQQRMMERYREQLEIKNDDEWKAIEPLIAKVTEARRNVGFGAMGRGMMGRPGGPGGDQAQGGGRRAFGGEPMPEMEALQRAVESNASAAEIKAALAKYRDARKAREANLAAAQENLRKVLTAKQEAQAVLMGLLN
jgi:hypothetical protein